MERMARIQNNIGLMARMYIILQNLTASIYGVHKTYTYDIILMPNGAKHWCFTWNNYTNDDKQRLGTTATQLLESGRIVYLVYGEEIGDSGTPHLQGFITFNKRTTLQATKRLLSPTVHLEQARGTPVQASQYCKKDGSYKEFGTCPKGRGGRSDLEQLSDRILAGASAKEIQEEFPSHYIRYRQNILASIRDMQPERNAPTHVVVLWGKTGAGKTRQVFNYHERGTIYVHTGENWFDGYDGQPVVLFDDYNGSEFKLSYLLKLLDRYPMRVPVKGGYVQWNPKQVYFTSNKDPKTWYANAHEEHQAALFRRINTIQHFD